MPDARCRGKKPSSPRRGNPVFLGGGAAELASAAGAAGLGAGMTLVVGYLLGGDCLDQGCGATQASTRSSRITFDLRYIGRCARKGPADVDDFATVMERLRRRLAEINRHDAARR